MESEGSRRQIPYLTNINRIQGHYARVSLQNKMKPNRCPERMVVNEAGTWGSPILHTTITCERLKQKGYTPLTEMYALSRKTLMNRRDTRPVRPVV